MLDQSIVERLTHLNAGDLIDLDGILIRYDGLYDWIDGPDRYTYTIMSHHIAPDGRDCFKASFGFQGLVQVGILPPTVLESF